LGQGALRPREVEKVVNVPKARLYDYALTADTQNYPLHNKISSLYILIIILAPGVDQSKGRAGYNDCGGFTKPI
jgi:hypothetical protein